MSEPIKVEVAAGGKASVDALSASLTALDEKIGKLSGTTSRAGEATRSLESELRKIQKAESGRVTAVTGLTQNIDALQAEITKLGRVGGATALKKELDSIKAAFNGFDNVGYKSIDEINKFRQNLDQALGNVGAVLAKKRGLTQGQFDVFLDVAKGVDASGKKVLEKVNAESSTIERAILMAGRRQAEAMRAAEMEKAKAGIAAAEAEIAAMQTTRVRVNQARLETMAPYSVLGGANQGLQKGSLVNQTRMSVDDVRNMLGMPSRDEMKTLAAQIKGQMSDALATAKMRVLSAPKMGLDETHAVLGLPSRKDMAAASAELKQWMMEQQAMFDRQVRARANQQTSMPAGGLPLGSFSVLGGAKEGTLVPGIPKSGAADLLHLEKMKLRLDDLHSAARGVASGFGAMWLTWGNLMPLLAGAALSNSIVQVVKLGAAVQNTSEVMRVLGEESVQSIAALNVQLLQLARNGPFGPLEVAEAMKTLTLAGLSATEVAASIKDVLNFAVAGDTSIAKSADVLTSVAKAFGIAADGYNYVADVIAKTAAVSKSSVDSIGEAFKTASVINKQYGVSLVDVGTGLAALSNLGIQGTAAGVALRNMYVDLSGRTAGTKKLLKEFNLELRDSNGNFKDIITIAGDVNRVLDSFQNNIAKKDFLQKALSERGAKPLIELLDLARRASKETGESVGTELDKLRQKIQDSAGFVIVAAAQMSLTPLNQMKSVIATMQATMVEAFSGLEPVILSVSGQLKDMFNAPEFKTALQNLIAGIASLTLWFVDHIKTIGLVIEAYLGFKAVAFVAAVLGGIERALLSVGVAAASAGIASTAAATGVTGLAGALGLAMRFLGPLAAVVTVAWGAWELYGMFTGKAKEKLESLATSSYSEQLIAKLQEETKRLEENADAKRKNMTLDQLREARSLAAMEQGVQEESAAKIRNAEAASAKAEKALADFKQAHTKASVFGTADYTQAVYLTSEANRARLAIDTAKTEVAALGRRVEEEKNKAKATAAVVQAYVERDKEAQDKIARGGLGSNLMHDPGKAKSEARDEHNTLRGLIAETSGFEKTKMQEIATLKAVLAQDVSKALENEKKQVAEITATYVAGVAARKAEISAVNVAVADGLTTEVAGQVDIARIQREGHAAELINITELTEATRNRIQTQIDLTNKARAEEGRMLAESLTKQIALVAKLNEKKGSSEYAKDYETELGKLTQMLEAQRTYNESLKDTDKLQQELLTNGISGTAKLTAATNAQVEALDAQYEAVKKEFKVSKDLYRDRAKGAAEMARFAADEASALADRLEQLAAELLSYGDLTAAEAVRQAAIARTRAELLNYNIASREAMNVDWVSASKKAVDDYATSLKNMAGEVANIFTKSFKGLEDVLTDFFTKGKADFKGFISSVVSDMARLAIRQNLVSPFVNWISGGLSGAGQSAGGSMMGSMLSSAGGSMLAGGGSMLSGAASTVGGWLGMGGGSAAAATGTGLLAGGGATGLSATMGTGYALGSGATGLGMTAGSVGASTIGAGIGTSGAVTGASTAAAGGGTSMLGAMGPWGWVALAVLAIASQAKGETRHGGQYGYSFDGSTATNARSGAKLSATEIGSVFAEGPSGGEIEADLVRKSITGTVKGIDGLLKGMGSAATVVGYQAGLESSDRGRGGVFSGGKLSTGATFGESGKGNNYEGTLYESTSSHSMDSKEALQAFTTDLMQGTIQALQAASDLPKSITEQLKGVDAESLTSEQAQALVTSIQTTVDGVTTLHDAMETMNLKALSFDAAAGLIKAAGGMDKLGSSLSTYYEKFYSAEEKAVATTKATSTAFAKLGITMPAVNEDLRLWYRGQIENLMAMDQTIEANAQATAGALALAGAVDQLAPAADGAVTSIQAFTDNVKQLVDGIHSSVSSSIFDMQYGLKDNEGKYGMLDTVAKGYDDQMRSAVDINKIAEYAQKEIDTINKAWDLLDPEQQAAKLAEMTAMLKRVDEFVTESGADAISRKKAENQALADAIGTGVKDALADIGTKLADAALSAASAATSVAETKAEPAQVNLLITNRAGAEVSIS